MRLTAAVQARQQFKYWQRFVETRMQQGYIRQRYHPIAGWAEKKREHWHYDKDRPWTDEALTKNRRKEALEPDALYKMRNTVVPIKDWKMFREDRVMVLVGKDKGKIGTINTIIKERNWIYVDGLNVEYKMLSPAQGADDICVRRERPLLATTQVALVDPEDDKPTTIEWRYTEEGEKVRVSKRTGRIVPLPAAYYEYDDLVIPDDYIPSKTKDTKAKVALEVTYQPKLGSFEEDIMDSMGIKEKKKRKPTYWY